MNNPAVEEVEPADTDGIDRDRGQDIADNSEAIPLTRSARINVKPRITDQGVVGGRETPAVNDLFDIDNESQRLSQEESKQFHSLAGSCEACKSGYIVADHFSRNQGSSVYRTG